MNFDNGISKPFLVEPGVKYFLNETLKQCHIFKEKYHNVLFNVSLFIGFVVFLAGLLIIKYKGKLTPQEKEQKEMEKKQYILSKIKNYQDTKLRTQQALITGLPQWETEYDLVHHKI
jgi:hypothetical protein